MGLALDPKTLDKYSKAYSRFLSYCDERGVRVTRARDVDRHLARFVQHLYDTAQPFGVASCAVFGLQHFVPWMRDRLGSAKLALLGWKRRHPSESHPPLTWELTCLLAVWMAARGKYEAAVALLLGFDCYLRIGELLALKVRDVALPSDARLGSAYEGVLLRLAKTKTGLNQSVTVESSAVAALLTSLVRSKARTPDARVFSLGRHTFYALFHKACRAFGLHAHRYSPHSLRHGGATRHHLLGRPIADIQQRGRWSNAKSVRTYIQAGRAVLLTTEVDSEVFDLASECARFVLPLLHLLRDGLPQGPQPARH